MFTFDKTAGNSQGVPTPFMSLNIGETFVHYSSYEKHGTNANSVWFFIKTSGSKAIKLTVDDSNPFIDIEPNEPVIQVELLVSKITVK